MINLLVELWNRSSHTLDQLLFLARCCETRRSTRLLGEQCLAQISTTTVLPQSYCLERSECHDHVPMYLEHSWKKWYLSTEVGGVARSHELSGRHPSTLLIWSDPVCIVKSHLFKPQGSQRSAPPNWAVGTPCFLRPGVAMFEAPTKKGFLCRKERVSWEWKVIKIVDSWIMYYDIHTMDVGVCLGAYVRFEHSIFSVWRDSGPFERWEKGVPRSSDTWISSVQTHLPFVAHWTTTTLWLCGKNQGNQTSPKETSHLHPELKLILGKCWRLIFEGVLFRDAPDIDSTMLKQHSDVWRMQDLSWSQKDLFYSPKPINLLSSRFQCWDDFFLGRQA